MAYVRPNVYPNGTPIPPSLPPSYQPAVYGAPAGQSCLTCKNFTFSTRQCSKWAATVKPRWWCEAWTASGLKVANNSIFLEKEEDVVKLNVPLLVRLMEYSREDAKTDADLHFVVERLVELSENGETLTMKNYADVVIEEPEVEDEVEVEDITEPQKIVLEINVKGK